MLCPEVNNFPPPKIITSTQNNVDMQSVVRNIVMNNFYRNLVITLPDEHNFPDSIEDLLCVDNEYYKIIDTSVTELMEESFIDTFVNNGRLSCLSVNRDCLVQNCVAVTPEGTLILHVLDYIYQTLGIQGSKQKHGYYELKIDLKAKKSLEKLKNSLKKLECFDIVVLWEPHKEDICPSTIAKYFFERNIKTEVIPPKVTQLSPIITEIPSIKDVDPDELAEWIGMLVIGGDLNPEYDYVSSYSQPISENALKTGRISILYVSGLYTPGVILKLCTKLSDIVEARDSEHYWASISYQSCTDAPWRWNYNCPSVFQSQENSTTVFFTKAGSTVYSVGHIKLS